MSFLPNMAPSNSSSLSMDASVRALLEDISLSEQFRERLRYSLDIIEEAFDRYPSPSLAIAFNGGKDCTVLFYLASLVCKRRGFNGTPLPVIYICPDDPFPEMSKFVEETFQKYGISKENVYQANGNVKQGLFNICSSHQNVKAVLMGTRRTDPYSSGLTDFAPTDPGWPPLMRVNPIVHWSLADIWTFIRRLGLPYCPLYDAGYTSIGSISNTRKNPALCKRNPDGTESHLPAHQLGTDHHERLGRHSSS